MQNECYAVAFRKKIYSRLEELQEGVNKWLNEYNGERTHSWKYCYVKTPLQTFKEAKHIEQEKMIGERNAHYHEKKENDPKGGITEVVTASELEGVR